MGQRTTKAERRNARARFVRGCREWGIARTARLMRDDPDLQRLPLALAVAIPPEIIAPVPVGNHWFDHAPFRGQYVPATGEVFDAPYNEPLPEPITKAIPGILDGLYRTLLRPQLERMGLDPKDYVLAFTASGTSIDAYTMPGPPLAYEPPATPSATDWAWEPPTPLEEA